MKRFGARAIEICLIGSSPSEALVTREMLATSKVLNNLHTLESQERALHYLHGEGEFARAEPVDLILLDLEMPDEAGYRVLDCIKRDPKLQTRPLAALVGAMNEAALERARSMRVNFLIEKPLDWPKLHDVIHATDGWWLCLVDIGSESSRLHGGM
jgi:two-component system response regulator